MFALEDPKVIDVLSMLGTNDVDIRHRIFMWKTGGKWLGTRDPSGQPRLYEQFMLNIQGTNISEYVVPLRATATIGLGMALAAATPRAVWGTNLHGRLLMRRRLLLEVDGPPHGPVGVAGHSSTEIGIG